MGLQKALYRFIVNNSEDHEEVDLDEIEPPSDGLDFKLYNLMRKKKISELNIENIDEVIYSISDKMLEKYTAAVRRALKNLMFFKCGYPQSKKIVNEAEVFSFINYFYLVIYIITRIFLP